MIDGVSIPSKYLGAGERVVVTTRTHPKVLALPALVLVVAVAAGVLLNVLVGGAGHGIVMIVVWVLVAAVVLWWSIRPLVAWLTTTYTFTDRRFIKRSGFISTEGRTIPLNRISGVDFEVGVIDRMFGCGTLVVSDASTDGRVEVPDIPRVERVQLLVSEELSRFGPGAGGAAPGVSRHDPYDDGS